MVVVTRSCVVSVLRRRNFLPLALGARSPHAHVGKAFFGNLHRFRRTRCPHPDTSGLLVVFHTSIPGPEREAGVG